MCMYVVHTYLYLFGLIIYHAITYKIVWNHSLKYADGCVLLRLADRAAKILKKCIFLYSHEKFFM